MMTVTANVITGVLEPELTDLLGGICICALSTLKVTGTVTTPAKISPNWIYGRPIMFKKGRWSYG